MRISNQSIFDNITSSLGKSSSKMVEANTVVSSTKRINKLSDDPVGIVTVLDLRASLSNIDQLKRNIDQGKSWLTMGESALGQVDDILVQLKQITVEMASANKDPEERANSATIVDGLMRQVKALANTMVGDRYIFAGTDTDTIPFAFDNETTPTTVTYSGNTTAFSVKIGRNTNVEVGRDGQDIFGTNWDNTNIFKTMIDLKAALSGNDVPGIQSAMDNLDSHLSTVHTMVSNTGAKMIRLDVKSTIIGDLDLSYTDRKSQLEDADIAEAIMDLQAMEFAYQAALSSAAKVMNLTLANFL